MPSRVNEAKSKTPEIVEAYDRYNCALLMLSMYDINLRTRITVKSYDLSESNNGKDICDRHISPMKSHIRQFVNEGHEVEADTDMKKPSTPILE